MRRRMGARWVWLAGTDGNQPCVQDPDLFAPGKREGVVQDASRAKALCATCPFINTCLLEALENSALGVWGGTDEAERRVMTPEERLGVQERARVRVRR